MATGVGRSSNRLYAFNQLSKTTKLAFARDQGNYFGRGFVLSRVSLRIKVRF